MLKPLTATPPGAASDAGSPATGSPPRSGDSVGARYHPSALRRLLHIVLTFLTVLSLLFCGASAVLWVRGYWRSDSFGWARPQPPGGQSTLFLNAASGGRRVLDQCRDSGADETRRAYARGLVLDRSPKFAPAVPCSFGHKPLGVWPPDRRFGGGPLTGLCLPRMGGSGILRGPPALPPCSGCPLAAAHRERALQILRIRPPRHARPLSGMRGLIDRTQRKKTGFLGLGDE